MISRHPLLAALLLLLFSCGPLSTASAHPISDSNAPATSLVELENQAFQEFKDGSYAKAEQTYAQFQILMKQQGYSDLQPDLLFNQALVHYHLGKPALAQAELRQAYLLTNNELYQNYIDQIQGIIELRAHKNSPNTVFVRGDSDSFMYWSMSQYYHPNNIIIAMFTSLCCICAFLTARVLIRRKTLKKLLTLLLVYFIVFFIVLGLIRTAQTLTDNMTFAVVIDSNVIRNEPNYNAPISPDLSFLPGITVQIVSQHDSWSLIQREDGQTAWIPAEGLYVLRSPNHVQ